MRSPTGAQVTQYNTHLSPGQVSRVRNDGNSGIFNSGSRARRSSSISSDPQVLQDILEVLEILEMLVDATPPSQARTGTDQIPKSPSRQNSNDSNWSTRSLREIRKRLSNAISSFLDWLNSNINPEPKEIRERMRRIVNASLGRKRNTQNSSSTSGDSKSQPKLQKELKKLETLFSKIPDNLLDHSPKSPRHFGAGQEPTPQSRKQAKTASSVTYARQHSKSVSEIPDRLGRLADTIPNHPPYASNPPPVSRTLQDIRQRLERLVSITSGDDTHRDLNHQNTIISQNRNAPSDSYQGTQHNPENHIRARSPLPSKVYYQDIQYNPNTHRRARSLPRPIVSKMYYQDAQRSPRLLRKTKSLIPPATSNGHYQDISDGVAWNKLPKDDKSMLRLFEEINTRLTNHILNFYIAPDGTSYGDELSGLSVGAHRELENQVPELKRLLGSQDSRIFALRAIIGNIIIRAASKEARSVLKQGIYDSSYRDIKYVLARSAYRETRRFAVAGINKEKRLRSMERVMEAAVQFAFTMEDQPTKFELTWASSRVFDPKIMEEVRQTPGEGQFRAKVQATVFPGLWKNKEEGSYLAKAQVFLC